MESYILLFKRDQNYLNRDIFLAFGVSLTRNNKRVPMIDGSMNPAVERMVRTGQMSLMILDLGVSIVL